MTIAYWCVFIALIFPYLLTAAAKISSGTYGPAANADPRTWEGKQAGRQKRLSNAHYNSFEAFPAFAAAVIIALQMNADQGRVDLLAMIFIGARILYSICYAADYARLRSLVWSIGFLTTIAIFFAGV